MSQLPAEILLSIIQASNLPMLYVWGLVCKVIRCFVAGELDTRHHRFLKPFISDIELFMNTLRLHGGIVAGSVALAYLEGARWKPNNCDIYLPYFGVHRFLAYLEMAEGYTVVEEGPEVEKVQVMIEGAQENDNSSVVPCHRRTGIAEVVVLMNPRGAIIRLIRAQSHHAVYPLTFSWSTLTMNFISGFGFCCLYPGYTTQKKALQNMLALRFCNGEITAIPQVRDQQHKYKLRGYTFMDAKVCAVNRGYTGQCVEHNDYRTGGSAEYIKWCEGSSNRMANCTTHGACPQDPRVLFDNHCFFFRFHNNNHSTQAKVDIHNPIFTSFRYPPSPDSRWGMEWRLGQYKHHADPGTAWCLGYTCTILSPEYTAYPQVTLYQRLVLHISGFEPIYETELVYLKTLPPAIEITQRIQEWISPVMGMEKEVEAVLIWDFEEDDGHTDERSVEEQEGLNEDDVDEELVEGLEVIDREEVLMGLAEFDAFVDFEEGQGGM